MGAGENTEGEGGIPGDNQAPVDPSTAVALAEVLAQKKEALMAATKSMSVADAFFETMSGFTTRIPTKERTMDSARSICRAYLGCFLLRSTRCAAFKDLEGGD